MNCSVEGFVVARRLLRSLPANRTNWLRSLRCVVNEQIGDMNSVIISIDFELQWKCKWAMGGTIISFASLARELSIVL